jgi:hypothetical protein
VTGLEVGDVELDAVQTMVEKAHRDIERCWTRAFDQQRADEAARAAELVAHAAELAAAKAERAAPGSVDDVKKAEASWWLLQRAAETALEMCQKAKAEEQA